MHKELEVQASCDWDTYKEWGCASWLVHHRHCNALRLHAANKPSLPRVQTVDRSFISTNLSTYSRYQRNPPLMAAAHRAVVRSRTKAGRHLSSGETWVYSKWRKCQLTTSAKSNHTNNQEHKHGGTRTSIHVKMASFSWVILLKSWLKFPTLAGSLLGPGDTEPSDSANSSFCNDNPKLVFIRVTLKVKESYQLNTYKLFYYPVHNDGNTILLVLGETAIGLIK